MPPDPVAAHPPAPRIAVITAVAGGKDLLSDPRVDPAGADFIAFVDARQEHLTGWDQRRLPQWSDDPIFAARRDAKVPKLLPWLLAPGYDYYIWIDGNFALKADPHSVCTQLLANQGVDIALFKHPWRSCVYEEAEAVMRLDLDRRELVEAQVHAYRRAGHAAQAGLFAGGFFAMRHSINSVRMCLAWWDHVCRFSSLDQLSLPIALKSTRCRYACIADASHLDNPYVAKNSDHLIPSNRSIGPLHRVGCAAIRPNNP